MGIKISRINIEWEHPSGSQNTVADVLSRNPIESIIGEKVNCAIIRDLVLSSRDQLIEEQRTDPELGHIYRYLENPEDNSVNATICDNWSRDFRNEIMREFHDKPLAGHFGRFKTYHKIKDVCYLLYMRKFIDQYVSTCHMCKVNNYENALPAVRLIPIVSNYPNEIVRIPCRDDGISGHGTEFAVGDIERLFEEAIRNTETKHENWKKYYNRRRRDVQIKVNDWKEKPNRKFSSAQHEWLQPQSTRGKRSGVPNGHGDEDTTRRASLNQEKQRKELQPLHRRAKKIKQQDCQTKSRSVSGGFAVFCDRSPPDSPRSLKSLNTCLDYSDPGKHRSSNRPVDRRDY
ncbi:hypothetical protein TNCV_4372271 [Trichonephila clavipes]|nr:hypothetical protein TNCV_4372271 [Trichonephila clavipes]